jgi:hypothetical protein
MKIFTNEFKTYIKNKLLIASFYMAMGVVLLAFIGAFELIEFMFN